MRAESHQTVSAVDALLQKQGGLPALRFITCGSVDDGKSTLIGRLLYDSRLLFDDQLSTLLSESKVYGTTGGISTSPCCWTGYRPNVNRASPSMSLIAFSPPNGDGLSLPTRRVMSNTREIWQPARPTPKRR